MARSLDTILVIDVESTCWEGSPPPMLTHAGNLADAVKILKNEFVRRSDGDRT